MDTQGFSASPCIIIFNSGINVADSSLGFSGGNNFTVYIRTKYMGKRYYLADSKNSTTARGKVKYHCSVFLFYFLSLAAGALEIYIL